MLHSKEQAMHAAAPAAALCCCALLLHAADLAWLSPLRRLAQENGARKAAEAAEAQALAALTPLLAGGCDAESEQCLVGERKLIVGWFQEHWTLEVASESVVTRFLHCKVADID